MAELKTKPNNASVVQFLNNVPDKGRREDSLTILRLMKKATRAQPKMWGASIIGFGNQHSVYASGREVDWFLIGFSPRKQSLTLYLTYDMRQHAALLKKLGKHKTGVGCLYINSLQDVNLPVLQTIIERSAKAAKPAARRKKQKA